MWRHANLDARTHQAFLDMLGPSPGSVYRHLYYFSKRRRMTDCEGQNIFLRQRRVSKHWSFPTLFLHGELSQVFNPQSATESAVRMALVTGGVAQPGLMWLKRVQDNGHMDIVFSRHAWKEVYPCLANFFQDVPRTSPSEIYSDSFVKDDSAHTHIRDEPQTGPLLRAAWIADGAVYLRLWGEIDVASATTIRGLKIEGQGARVEREWRIRACEHRYRLLDVRLDPGMSDVTFSLVHDPANPIAIKHVLSSMQLLHAVADQAVYKSDLVYSEQQLPWLARLKRWARRERPTAMSFLVGSCRYPGTPFERDAADAVFSGMLRHVSDVPPDNGIDLLFLIGDQIYADATANLLDAESWRERYCARYQQALSSRCSPNLAQLVKRVPTHFAVDDHEFGDNWQGLPCHGADPAAENRHRLAKRAARSYLGSGRDSRGIPGGGARSGSLWYPLNHECEAACPCFVMDTRSERRLRKGGQSGLQARITNDTQWRALENWLGQFDDKSPYRNHPKFIFSASVVAPVSRDFQDHPELWRREDGWAGYPASLAALVRLIMEKQIQHVVFVGGDLHFSAFGRLTLELDGYTPITAWQIVSSGLYAPMPFANADPRDFDWNQDCRIPIPGSNARITANVGLLSTQNGNFVRVGSRYQDAAWDLAVSAHGAGGEPLQPVTSPPPPARSDVHSWVISLTGSSAQTAARQFAGARG
jgi:cholesterol oxidase